MNNADELRSRLVKLAAEMDYAIAYAVDRLQDELRKCPPAFDEATRGWKKGIVDAITILRPASEAHDRFVILTSQVVKSEPDACGLTAEERGYFFGQPNRK